MEKNILREIKLWVREEGVKSSKRLICVIRSSSKFHSMPWFNRINNCTDEDLIRAAEDQRNGWKNNGPWPNAIFELEAFGNNGKEIAI